MISNKGSFLDHYLPQVDVALKDPWRNSENEKVIYENKIGS